MRTTERVVFRLIQIPCCNQLLCWVNPRYPTYCPECGKFVYDRVKGCVLSSDDNATLKCDLVDRPPQEDSEVEQLRVGQVIEVDWVGGWYKFWVTSLDKETVTIASLERAPIRFDRRNLPKWRPA